MCVCMFSTSDVMCTLDWHAGALLSVNTSECASAVYYTSATTPVVFLQRERGFTRTLPSIKEKVRASGVTPPHHAYIILDPFPPFHIYHLQESWTGNALHTESSLTPSLLSLPLLSLSFLPLSLSSLPFQMAMG